MVETILANQNPVIDLKIHQTNIKSKTLNQYLFIFSFIDLAIFLWQRISQQTEKPTKKGAKKRVW